MDQLKTVRKHACTVPNTECTILQLRSRSYQHGVKHKTWGPVEIESTPGLAEVMCRDLAHMILHMLFFRAVFYLFVIMCGQHDWTWTVQG